jgi:tetratricopeptide (TPR) repeat protein
MYRLGLALITVIAITFIASVNLKEDSSSSVIQPQTRSNKMQFSEVTGLVHSGPVDGEHRTIRSGETFTNGAVIRTSAASASTVLIPHIGKIQIGSNSEISFRKKNGTLEIDLFTGRILANIEPNHERAPVQLFAGEWQVRVLGTVFEVIRSKENKLSVYVSKGVVEVKGPEKKARLTVGESFHSTASGGSKLNSKDKTLEITDKGKQAAGKKNEKASIPSKHVKPKRIVSKKNTQKRQRRRSKDKTRTNKQRPFTPAPALNPVREKALRAMVLPETQLSTVKIPSDLLQYQNADEALDPKQAIEMFDSVAESDSSHAEVAAHRAAKLTLEQGNDKEALRRYQVIRDRFRKGVHVKATGTSLIALRLKHCKLHEGRGDLNRFLRENPQHAEDKDLAFLSGELYRRTKKYNKAIEDYTRSFGSQYDEDAMYFKAWSLLALDPNSKSAQELINAYQTKYPKGRYSKEIDRVLEEPPAE